ncbi:NPC intracellular cholesterol transporter 2-like [Penaeus japonicus]|uniref:ML protein n=1 Tax=Penaeus japonicus TaxID=27405 RepID=A0A5B8H9Q3_PENJP|nr:NPC intracellular cholesterol transporter 2-like [Penaeus japonicus]QDX01887.1 ML protein [Penaeus japonicus]
MTALFFVLGLLSVASATFFQDCGSVGADVELLIEGCNVPPCILQRGNTYPFEILFTSSKSSSELRIDAYASIGGVLVPWPGLDTDGCKQLQATGTPCPLDEGDRVLWHMDVYVLHEFPAIATVATFKLLDSQGDSQACVVVPVQLV